MKTKRKKIEFKDYPKRYMSYYGREFSEMKNPVTLYSVETVDNTPDINIYAKEMHDHCRQFGLYMWDFLVKYKWLCRRFLYKGKRKQTNRASGYTVERAFGIYMNKIVGVEPKFYTPSMSGYNKLATYFDEVYPDFDISNPFEVKYEFPFEFIGAEYLFTVYRMDERMDILREADRKRLSYADYLDYVINYIHCVNEEHGDTYEFIKSATVMPYVRPYGEQGVWTRETTVKKNSPKGMRSSRVSVSSARLSLPLLEE